MSAARPPSGRPILAPAPRTAPIEIGGREPVPITLLTGFLGAGKTTLLNRILRGDHGLRVGVLVNDFGDINIDAALVEDVAENMVSLTNGCICCEVRDDLVAELERLLIDNPRIDFVVIEASGVAEPSGIVMTFLDQRYERLFRLDSVTCLVDAEGIFAHAGDQALTMLKLRQIGFADLVILNKTDLVGPEHLEVVRDWIALHMQRVRIVESTMADLPLELLLSVGRFDPEATLGGPSDGSSTPADDLFERWSFTATIPFERSRLEAMVRKQLPESVYRCKGVVYTEDEPDVPMVLQVVGRRTDLRPGTTGRGDRQSRIVAIGNRIDPGQLDTLFNGCLSDTGE